MITQSEIESLGWTNRKHSIDDWYELHYDGEAKINRGLSFRSWRLLHGYKDDSVAIWGYEYSSFSPNQEVLFSGSCTDYETLKYIMKLVNII